MSKTVLHTIKCLWCNSKVQLNGFSEHIHRHLDYWPERCTSCDFASHSRDALNTHIMLNMMDHVADKTARNDYLEHMVRMLESDMIYATKHGKDELMKRKSDGYGSTSTAPSGPSTSTKTVNGSTSSSSSRRRLRSPSPESDDEGPSGSRSPERRRGRTTTDRTPPITKRNGNYSTRDDEENYSSSPRTLVSGKSDERTQLESVADSMKSSITSVKCLLCMQPFDTAIQVRQAHISRVHMRDVTNNDALYMAVLESKTHEAFPNLPWKSTQCIQCYSTSTGAGVVSTISGRVGHVARFHTTLRLQCPIDGCTVSSSKSENINNHLRERHGFERGRLSLIGDLKARFDHARKQFKRSLEETADRYFPLPLVVTNASATFASDRAASPTHSTTSTNRRQDSSFSLPEPPSSTRSMEVVSKIREKTLAGLRPAPHKRAHKSDSSDDESDGEEDERRKKKKEEEDKDKKKKEEDREKKKEIEDREKKKKARISDSDSGDDSSDDDDGKTGKSSNGSKVATTTKPPVAMLTLPKRPQVVHKPETSSDSSSDEEERKPVMPKQPVVQTKKPPPKEKSSESSSSESEDDSDAEAKPVASKTPVSATVPPPPPSSTHSTASSSASSTVKVEEPQVKTEPVTPIVSRTPPSRLSTPGPPAKFPGRPIRLPKVALSFPTPTDRPHVRRNTPEDHRPRIRRNSHQSANGRQQDANRGRGGRGRGGHHEFRGGRGGGGKRGRMY